MDLSGRVDFLLAYFGIGFVFPKIPGTSLRFGHKWHE